MGCDTILEVAITRRFATGTLTVVVPDRGKRVILALFVILIPLPLVLLAALGGVGEPFRALKCGWQSRDGWIIEHPVDALTDDGYREFTNQQTSCVEIEVVYVNTDLVDDGIVVSPRGARSWFGQGETFTIRVEAQPANDVVECGESLSEIQADTATEILTC